MSTSLSIQGLSKTFGGLNAVDDVSFALDDGAFTALIGPNGAGKTTLFNLLSGTSTPSAGRVLFGTNDVTHWPAHRRAQSGIGRTFQIASTFRSMTVTENIETAFIAANQLPSGLQELMQETGVAPHAKRLISELAYGDIKRVELTMALATVPRLLLLDEPTAGLSQHERREMMEIITRLTRARGLTVLFTEHDMEAVFGTADRVLVIDQGKLIADGSPAEIQKNAEVKRIYLGEDEAEHA